MNAHPKCRKLLKHWSCTTMSTFLSAQPFQLIEVRQLGINFHELQESCHDRLYQFKVKHYHAYKEAVSQTPASEHTRTKCRYTPLPWMIARKGEQCQGWWPWQQRFPTSHSHRHHCAVCTHLHVSGTVQMMQPLGAVYALHFHWLLTLPIYHWSRPRDRLFAVKSTDPRRLDLIVLWPDLTINHEVAEAFSSQPETACQSQSWVLEPFG